jgi:hypothetical protein
MMMAAIITTALDTLRIIVLCCFLYPVEKTLSWITNKKQTKKKKQDDFMYPGLSRYLKLLT